MHRFGLTSFQVGAMLSSYDVIVLLTVFPLSYMGRHNKARALGIGLGIFAVGCFVYTLPQVRR